MCVTKHTHTHFQLCQVCMWVCVTLCVCVTVCQRARQPVNVLENCGSNIFILCSEEASLTSFVYSLSCRITNSCTDTDALFIYSLLRYPPPKKKTDSPCCTSFSSYSPSYHFTKPFSHSFYKYINNV